MAGTNGGSAMDTQHWYWIAAAAAVLVAIGAGFADHRRQRRDRLDDIGWVPWRGIQVGAAFSLLVIIVLALKVG
jgi:phosphoglycerol transferase MdoB-like AlkP superfamily enzyme